jgi:two-component system response regulator MprA
VLHFSDLTLDLGSLCAKRGVREFKLSVTEANMLELFMRNPRQVLSRSLVFERIWGRHLGTESNTIDVYVGYLRRKTESAGESRVIHTVRGAGYVLSER